MGDNVYTLYKLVSTFNDMYESIPGSDSKPEIMLKMCDEIEKQFEVVKKELNSWKKYSNQEGDLK